MLTFGGHLEVLRQMAFRILGVTCAVAIAVFCLKDTTWHLLLAPSQCDFVTYSWTERILHTVGMKDFHFEDFHIKLIATNLTSQFMTHLTTSIYLGLLIASPYILYELFCFISPALFDRERRYSIKADRGLCPCCHAAALRAGIHGPGQISSLPAPAGRRDSDK